MHININIKVKVNINTKFHSLTHPIIINIKSHSLLKKLEIYTDSTLKSSQFPSRCSTYLLQPSPPSTILSIQIS